MRQRFDDEKEKEIYFKYETARRKGLYNMFSESARILSELSKKEYLYAMKYYATLKDKFNQEFEDSSKEKEN